MLSDIADISSSPSFCEDDVLEARIAAQSTFRTLFIRLGTVVLLIGGIGIASVMIMAVIEHRNEIGSRRALGV